MRRRADLGLRFRRARSPLYGEPVALVETELARIRAGFLRDLDAEADALAVRSRAVRGRLARFRDLPRGNVP